YSTSWGPNQSPRDFPPAKAHIDYDVNFFFDYDSRLAYRIRQPHSSRGVFRRRTEGGARRGVPRSRLRNRDPGGEGNRPSGTTTWPRGARCRQFRRKCRKPKRIPAQKRHGGAPRGARPFAEGRKAPRKRLACRARSAFTRVFDAGSPRRAFDAAGRTGARNTRAALGAPLPLGSGTDPRLGPLAPRERIGLFDIVR